MRIVFFGEDSFSAIVLESLILAKHDIAAVFCPIYKNNIHVRLELVCKKNKISFQRVSDINSEDVQFFLNHLNIDLIAVCHFEKVLKKNIIDIPKLGCRNSSSAFNSPEVIAECDRKFFDLINCAPVHSNLVYCSWIHSFKDVSPNCVSIFTILCYNSI